jgi:methyltransferase
MVTSTVAYLGFLLLLTLERLFELRLSQRHRQAVLARGGYEVGAEHFTMMSVMHSAFFVACASEVVLLKRPFHSPLGYIAMVAALLAQALRYWAIMTLGDRWNVRIIVDPKEAPIVTGPYRFVRHPNYVAVVIEMMAVPLIHGAYLTAIVFSLVNAGMLKIRITSEERALGETYQQAFSHRRRFLPGRETK